MHIGCPKTGTTSIQRFCNKNKSGLLDQGAIYPGSEVCHHSLLTIFHSSHESKRFNLIAASRGIDVKKHIATEVDMLVNEINSHKDKNIIISNEYIFR